MESVVAVPADPVEDDLVELWQALQLARGEEPTFTGCFVLEQPLTVSD